MAIILSRLGKGQLVDIEHSKEELHDNYFRTCTVLQNNPPKSDIGDTIPHHIAKLYGGDWSKWNRHFIVQVAGCPLKCWYCYVDNLEYDWTTSIENIVDKFIDFRSKVSDLNVFHLMGGCPGRYATKWRDFRSCLDAKGLRDVVFLSDVILMEYKYYGVKPWENIPERSIISVCLKGSNFQNFESNTGVNGFAYAIRELVNYLNKSQIHFSTIAWDEKDRDYIERLMGYEIDWMTVKRYEVVKRRLSFSLWR